MRIPTKLELAKDFIELSILMSSDKKFRIPDYDKSGENYRLLYKALLELKRDGIVDINSSCVGEMVVVLNRARAF